MPIQGDGSLLFAQSKHKSQEERACGIGKLDCSYADAVSTGLGPWHIGTQCIRFRTLEGVQCEEVKAS